MGNSVSARHTREANQQMTSSNSESSEIGNDLNQYQITNTENRDLIEKKILKLARVDGKSFNPEYLDFDSNSAMEDLFKKRTRLQNENNLSIDPGKNIEGIENIQRPGKIFIKADLLLKINVNSHDQINIERLPIAPSIKHSHPVSDKSFSQAETRFAGQIIVELEEDRVVSEAAKRLAGKHAERSLIIQLKKDG
ncbi:C80 family cysteine peptidase, partial [Candidatus Williamhamiltonella defendens]|uniref:C80 family cysteine peptidase n=1 Tax=Candidatus Williamhamiltonella defendens TaxID=138072 RepID=UPI001582E284